MDRMIRLSSEAAAWLRTQAAIDESMDALIRRWAGLKRREHVKPQQRIDRRKIYAVSSLEAGDQLIEPYSSDMRGFRAALNRCRRDRSRSYRVFKTLAGIQVNRIA